MAFVPVAAAFLAANAATIGTVLGVGSAVVGGASAISQGNYQAAVARNNAIVAEQNSNQEEIASQKEAARSDREYAAALGEQLAAQGASGFDILGRTQMATRNVTRKTRADASMDIRQQGTNTARRLNQDAANFRADARSSRAQGYVTGIGSFLDAGRQAANGFGGTRSLVNSRRGGRRPWDQAPNWYGRG